MGSLPKAVIKINCDKNCDKKINREENKRQQKQSKIRNRKEHGSTPANGPAIYSCFSADDEPEAITDEARATENASSSRRLAPYAKIR